MQETEYNTDKMKTQDFIVLLLDAFGGKAESETRMQKLTFLAKKERNIDLDVKFRWHHYGPFSDGLKKTLNKLQENDLIKIDKENRKTFMGDAYNITLFELTKKGKAKAYCLRDSESPDLLSNINMLVRQTGQNSLSEILSYVYKVYSPEDL